MGSIAVSQRNAMLNALAGRANYVASAGVYVQLHTGDPGSAGTANPATETTRAAATFGVDAASGSISNTAAVDWTAIDAGAGETITHVSLWSAAVGGTYLGQDDVPGGGQPVTTGNDLTLSAGSITLSINDPA